MTLKNKVETGNLTQRGRGRPKGSKNKTTATAKAIIEETADNLGGAKRLTAWAQEAPENERAFWATIYPKLLPLQVNGPGENGEHKIEVGEGAAKLAAFIGTIAERKDEA